MSTPKTGGERTDESVALLVENVRNDALAYAQSIVETVREPLLILDCHLRLFSRRALPGLCDLQILG